MKADAAVERIRSIDALRGIAVLLMAVGNFGLGVRWVPAQLKHAPDIGFTIADLVAPIFIVSIAFTTLSSLQRRRAKDGTQSAMAHAVFRALLLIVIGSVISIGQAILRPAAGVDLGWGVLQAIGAASLLVLPVLLIQRHWRLVVALLLLFGYQWLLDHDWLALVLRSEHNGIWGSMSWAGMLLLGTVIADGFNVLPPSNQRHLFLARAGLLSLTVALALSPWISISKHRASATYMLLSLGLALLALAMLDLWLATGRKRLEWIQRLGRNPLLLYFANLLLLAVFTLPNSDAWYAGAPIWLSVLQVSSIVGMNFLLARLLDQRGLAVRL